ncbi:MULTISPECIES: LysR family transcriptional regulator [Enterobacterales]|uniref:LysR family transcriptional regulator n=1 Tax=Enterobacterales TaxID=91347 RepID=UPI002EDA23C7
MGDKLLHTFMCPQNNHKDWCGMINLRNLRNFDLNVLPLFLSAYKHSSIKKAAQELDTSSSNVTQGINKLRKHFNDPLFVRVGQGIEPTIFCTQLHSALQSSFSDIYGSMFSTEKKEEIVIYAPDGPMLDFIYKYAKAQDTGSLPKITHISTVVDGNMAAELFSFRKADIVITHEKIFSPGIISIKLYKMNSYIAYNHRNPQLADPVDRKNSDHALLTLPWVTINNNHSHYQSIRKNNLFIANIIKNRTRVAFESTALNLNLLFIEKNNAIGFIPEMFCKHMNEHWRKNITLLPVPELEIDIYINYKTNAKDLLRVIDIFRMDS